MKKLGGEGGGSGGGGIDDTAFSEDIVEFTLGVCEGPIAGLVAGPKGFYLGDTALVSPVGDNNFSAFQLDVYHGSDIASPIHNELGGVSSSTNVGVTLASTVAVTRTTSPALRNKIDALEIRIIFNRLVHYTSKGKEKTQDAIFKIEYKPSSSATWLPFRSDFPIVFNGKSSGGLIKEYRRTVPRMAGDDWDIRVTKVSSDDTVSNIVSMGWESFQCVTAEDRSYDGLAAVKGLAKASDQFSSIPVFQGIWAGKLIKMPDNYNPVTRFYNTGVWGGTLVTGHTDNGAWAVYDMLMNTKSGMKRHYPDLLTDRYSFYDAGKWCDALVPRGDTGTFQPRWTYNDVLDQPRLGIEQARYVAASFGGVLISDLNKTIKIKMDQPGSMVQIFGPESVSADGFQYQYSDISQRPNDINVSFVSPELGWETDMRRVFDQSLIDANGRIPFEFIAVGCIDAYEAQRRAQNILIKANTEVTTVNFTTARQGMLLELYDIIGVSDPDMGWGLAGRIKSTAGTVINLRDALTLPVATNITMSIQTSTGIITRTVRAPTAVTKVLNITAGGALPGTIPARAQFTLAQATVGLVKPFRIVGIALDASNPDMYAITALELNTNRFGDVDNMISSGVQEYASIQSKIPPAPVIQSVTSGGGQQTVGQDGTLFSDMEVQLLAPSVALSRMVIYYRAIGDSGYRHINTLALNTLLPGVEPGETYEVYAVSEDITGNRSRPSPVTTHTVALRALAPAIPGVWTGVAGFDTIKLTGPAIPDVEIGQYKIYAATAASTALTLVGTTTTPEYLRRPPSGDAYTRYKVAAVSRSGVEGPPSAAFINVVPLTSLASTIPAVPAGLALATAFQLDNSLKVTATWTANTEANLSHYLVRVVEGGNTTITPSNTPRIDFSRFSGTTLQVSVAAVNKLGLASNFCTAVSVTTPVDTIAPAVPTGLAITPGFQTFWASWGASDDLDIHHYELYMATATTAPTVGTAPTYISVANNFVVSGWTGVATQNFWVRAVDNAGNKSAWSTLASATTATLDATLPATAIPTGLALTSSVVVRADGTLVTILSVSWSAVSGAASYLLSLTRAGASEIILPVSGLSYEAPVFPGVLYTAKIQSVNAVGLKSAQSAAVTLTPPGDLVAPAVPAAVTALGGFGSILLGWTANTEPDLDRYEIYESDTTTAPLVGTAATFTSASNTVSLTGLAEGLTRNYWVRAVDTSGNKSAWSSIASATTATLNATQTAAPVPTGLTLATESVSGVGGSFTSLIRASWVASANAVSYEVSVTRSGAAEQILATGGLSAEFNALAGQSHAVKVRSVNNVGAKSAWTSVFSITSATDAVAPAVPTGLVATGGFENIWLKLNRNTEADFNFYEVYESAATTAPLVGTAATFTTSSESMVRTGLTGAAVTLNYWVRAVDTSGNKSAWSARVAASTTILDTADVQGLIDATSFASGIKPVEIVTTLPAAPHVEGRQVYLTTDKKLYRNDGTKWTNEVDGGDLKLNSVTTGSVAAGAIKTAQLDAGAVTASKMLIGDTSNIFPDPDMVDAASYSGDAFTLTANSWGSSKNVLTINSVGGTVDKTVYSSAFTADGNLEYQIANKVGISGSSPVTPARLDICWYSDAAATVLISQETLRSASSTGGRTTRQAVIVKAPVGARRAKLAFIRVAHATATTSAVFNEIVIRRAAAGELIVDGAITAIHVGANEVITNSANIKDAIITNAKIVELSAAKLMAGTAIAETITVTGTALSAVKSDASLGAQNPVTRINAGVTQIDPGKIVISGATTLADWRNGSDTTKIEGGNIAANSVSANKLEIGSRNITLTGVQFEHNAPAANRASWTAGQIRYVNDAGATASANIAAGSTAVWTSGVLYIYWVKDATSFSSTTVLATAFAVNNVVLATYEGTTKLDADYGRTIIDGSNIKTGTITATQLITTSALITAQAQIANAMITDGHITNLSAAKLTAGSALAATITVSGTALSSIKADAALGATDPATRVNAGVTTIDPGKIVISGATTLADWRGTDTTTINGGAIETDSISTRQIKIGALPNLIQNGDFSDNLLPPSTFWTTSGGVIAWETGAAHLFKGSPVLRMTKALSTSNHLAYANPAKRFAALPGERFAVDVNIKGAVAAAVGLWVRVVWYDAAGSLLASISEVVANVAIPTVYTNYTGQVVAPASAASGELRFVNASTQTTNLILYVGSARVQRTSGTIDIADEAITGAKLITTESVITATAQIKDAVITDAKIATLSAAKLVAGTALAGSITVSGTALSMVESRAADPAARVNAASTQIDPGKIVISGATTLADWRGTDTTTINGGAIEANTVASNKLVVGSRALTVTGIQFDYNAPSANRVAWSAGVIRYINDAGTPTTAAITANSAGTLWSTGVLYIYWAKGATTLSTTTTQATAFGANNVVIATYGGGADLVTDFGKTIIDGGTLKTGSVKAAQLDVTTAVITGTAQIADAVITNAKISGALQSTGYVPFSTGWSIDKAGTAEFNNMVVRGWIQNNAVSDKLFTSYAGPLANIPATSSIVLATLSLGACLSGEIRKYGVAYEAQTNNGANYSVNVDIRFKYLGVWGAWKNKTTDNQGVAWESQGYSATLAGVYDDVEIRVSVTRPSSAGTAPTNCIKNVYITCVNLVK